VGEIAPEQDFTTTNYGSRLGERTLTRYYSTYSIPKGVILSALGDTRTFEAHASSITLYRQTLIAGLRFPIPLFFRELLLNLALALRQLRRNAWWITIGCMIL